MTTLDIAELRDAVVRVVRHRGPVVGLDESAEKCGSHRTTSLYAWIKKADLADGAPARRDRCRRADLNRRDPQHQPQTGVPLSTRDSQQGPCPRGSKEGTNHEHAAGCHGPGQLSSTRVPWRRKDAPSTLR